MIKLIRPYFLGVKEARSGFGLTYDGDPESARSRAYDHGRNLGELIFDTWDWIRTGRL